MSSGSINPFERAVGCALGLAAGEASGWVATQHRSRVLPPWTRRLRRELDTFGEQNKLTTPAMPFSLNQPVDALQIGPADDAEWFVFTSDHLVSSGAKTAGGAVEAWLPLVERRDEIWASIAAKSALDNLAKGTMPPISGHDQPHFADGSALPRSVAYGLFWSGDPMEAASYARADAQVTNADDGVWAAGAFAAAISAAASGASITETVEAAKSELPDDSLATRLATLALSLSVDCDSAYAIVPEIEAAFVDHVYSYPLGAAEYLAASLALVVAADGAYADAVAASACIARYADSVPALVGALCGALGSPPPEAWAVRCDTLVGCCLPELAGRSVRAVTEELVAASTESTAAVSGTHAIPDLERT